MNVVPCSDDDSVPGPEYAFLIPSMCESCCINPTIFCLITRIKLSEKIQVGKLITYFSPFHVITSFLGPNVYLSAVYVFSSCLTFHRVHCGDYKMCHLLFGVETEIILTYQ